MSNQYRVKESKGRFYAQRLITEVWYETKWFGLKRKTIEEEKWVTMDMHGREWRWNHLGPIPPMAEFDSLKEAKEFVQCVSSPDIIHEV